MKIPKIISKDNQEYIFVKEYKNYILYENMLTKTKQCFHKQELGLVKEVDAKYTKRNRNPEKVVIL